MFLKLHNKKILENPICYLHVLSKKIVLHINFELTNRTTLVCTEKL